MIDLDIETRAVDYVSELTHTHNEAVTRFYHNRHSKHIFNENQIIGLLVEEAMKRIALERAAKQMAEALKALDAHIDFKAEASTHEGIVFTEASGINVAFKDASAALAEWEKVRKQ